MAENWSRPSHTFNDVQREQLHIYAVELGKLHALLRSRSRVWLEAEERLRAGGTHTEALCQVLNSAYMCSELMLEGELCPEGRQDVAKRLHHLLERALSFTGEYKRGSGAYGRDDLGLAALLRQEVYILAPQCGWDVQIDTETVRPCALSETAAYLIVREALQCAVLSPRTRRVTLTLKTRGDQLVTRVIAYKETKAWESPGADTAGVFLTRLYARLAGGSCRWRTVSDSAADFGEASEMELALPLGTSEMPERQSRVNIS